MDFARLFLTLVNTLVTERPQTWLPMSQPGSLPEPPHSVQKVQFETQSPAGALKPAHFGCHSSGRHEGWAGLAESAFFCLIGPESLGAAVDG